MKIERYEKKGNNNYLIYLSDGRKIKINEDVILKHKLLYKREIDESLLDEIIKDNNDYDIYNKCVKYIGVRLRSKYEMIDFMKKKRVREELIDETIDRLVKNKLIDDEVFTKAFINDKFKFTTMGPYRIIQELEKQHINNDIIYKYISTIDESMILEKMDKQILKLIKSNKNKPNLRNKIYNNLIGLGYSADMIISNINKYNL